MSKRKRDSNDGDDENDAQETARAKRQRHRAEKKNFELLRIALWDGDQEGVQALLEQGVDANGDGEIFSTRSPLSRACSLRHVNVEIVKLLFEHGASVGTVTLHTASDNLELAKVLMENGADVNSKDCQGTTPLTQTCIGGDLEIVKLFVENGADTNTKSNRGENPLLHAC